MKPHPREQNPLQRSWYTLKDMSRPGLALGIVAFAVLFFASLWIRLQYVFKVGMHIDEFTTLWSAHRILETGLPLMPSGVVYTRGIPTTYLMAAFLAIGGETSEVGRLSSITFGMAAIVMIAIIGRTEWNGRVGWIAALGLALLPEAITWSARARFYAPFLFLAMLTIWSAYRAITSEESAGPGDDPPLGKYLIFALLYSLTVATHEATVLLFPTIAVSIVIWRGWSYLFKPVVFSALAICAVALLLRYGLEIVAQPGYFGSIQEQKPYLAFQGEFLRVLQAFADILLQNARKYWTVTFLIGLVTSAIALVNKRGRVNLVRKDHQATLFFAAQFLGVSLIMVTIIGRQWLGPRAVFFLLPCWLLISAAGAVWLIDSITTRPVVRWLFTGVLSLGIVFVMWPYSLNVLEQDTEGYEYALTYVNDIREASDVVMTQQPAACAWVLGDPCDYYARLRGFRAYTIERDGERVDRWTGSSLLSSPQELRKVVQTSPRAWFVIDTDRFVNRYNDEFIRVVVEQFDRVYQYEDTVVLLAEGWRTPPVYPNAEKLAQPITVGPLELTGWEYSEALAGSELFFLLQWQASGQIDRRINTSLQFVHEGGQRLSQDDGLLGRGLVSPTELPDLTLPDPKHIEIPPDLADGLYRIELVAYDSVTHTPIAQPVPLEWFRFGPDPVEPKVPHKATWSDDIQLIGHSDLPDQLASGDNLSVDLVWQAVAPVNVNYTAFVHLVDEDGNLVSQHDREPLAGFYPVSHWPATQLVKDTYTLQLPDTADAGEYRVLVGWYNSENGVRLPLLDGSDALEIDRIQIK